MRRVRLGLAVAILIPGVAVAVCVDPRNPGTSGYHPPLDEEIRSSAAIAVVKVVAMRKVHDVRNDPETVLAMIYSARVDKVLKGRLAPTITLRAENDSGRYAMDVGERHVVFLDRLAAIPGAGYGVNNCGSSSMLPAGEEIVRRVEARIKLRGSRSPLFLPSRDK
jgi:hypothetical protein